jgi:hypothetical protein
VPPIVGIDSFPLDGPQAAPVGVKCTCTGTRFCWALCSRPVVDGVVGCPGPGIVAAAEGSGVVGRSGGSTVVGDGMVAAWRVPTAW